MDRFNAIADVLNSGPTLNLHLGKYDISPSYVSAALIVLLLFFLVLTLAQVRRHLMDYSFKGASAGIFLGFLLAIIIEGFLLIGGKTFLIAMFGWNTAPKPVATALEIGREKFQNVLGVSNVSIQTGKRDSLVKEIIGVYSLLDTKEKEEVSKLMCR